MNANLEEMVEKYGEDFLVVPPGFQVAADYGEGIVTAQEVPS